MPPSQFGTSRFQASFGSALMSSKQPMAAFARLLKPMRNKMEEEVQTWFYSRLYIRFPHLACEQRPSGARGVLRLWGGAAAEQKRKTPALRSAFSTGKAGHHVTSDALALAKLFANVFSVTNVTAAMACYRTEGDRSGRCRPLRSETDTVAFHPITSCASSLPSTAGLTPSIPKMLDRVRNDARPLRSRIENALSDRLHAIGNEFRLSCSPSISSTSSHKVPLRRSLRTASGCPCQ